MHVVRLLAPTIDREDHTKDIDFSLTGIRRAALQVMLTRAA
jgi:NTE family protein